MKHAGPKTLGKLKPLLEQIEDPCGLFADVRLDDEWERTEVTTASQRERLARRFLDVEGMGNSSPRP